MGKELETAAVAGGETAEDAVAAKLTKKRRRRMTVEKGKSTQVVNVPENVVEDVMAATVAAVVGELLETETTGIEETLMMPTEVAAEEVVIVPDAEEIDTKETETVLLVDTVVEGMVMLNALAAEE